MTQKWDYKAVLRRSTMGEVAFEIDGQKVARPSSSVELFKELGQDGWEMVAHSASALPSPVQSMGMTGDELPMFDEKGRMHPLRQPSLTYSWVFKRPTE